MGEVEFQWRLVSESGRVLPSAWFHWQMPRPGEAVIWRDQRWVVLRVEWEISDAGAACASVFVAAS